MEGSRELYEAGRDDYVRNLAAKLDELARLLAKAREENEALRGANTEQGDRIELLQGELIEAIQEREEARHLACTALAAQMPEYPDSQQPEAELVGAVLAGPGRVRYVQGGPR